jgi:hypothetical protein
VIKNEAAQVRGWPQREREKKSRNIYCGCIFLGFLCIISDLIDKPNRKLWQEVLTDNILYIPKLSVKADRFFHVLLLHTLENVALEIEILFMSGDGLDI